MKIKIYQIVVHLKNTHYGKYHGLVIDNKVPEHLGRLKIQILSLLGETVK